MEQSQPPSASKTKRKSAAGRSLIRWDFEKDQHLLLCLEYEAVKRGIPLPWDEAIQHIKPGATGQAAIQHLTKVRKYRQDKGQAVPPEPTKRRSIKKATGTSGKKQKKVDDYDDDEEDYEIAFKGSSNRMVYDPIANKPTPARKASTIDLGTSIFPAPSDNAKDRKPTRGVRRVSKVKAKSEPEEYMIEENDPDIATALDSDGEWHPDDINDRPRKKRGHTSRTSAGDYNYGRDEKVFEGGAYPEPGTYSLSEPFADLKHTDTDRHHQTPLVDNGQPFFKTDFLQKASVLQSKGSGMENPSGHIRSNKVQSLSSNIGSDPYHINNRYINPAVSEASHGITLDGTLTASDKHLYQQGARMMPAPKMSNMDHSGAFTNAKPDTALEQEYSSHHGSYTHQLGHLNHEANYNSYAPATDLPAFYVPPPRQSDSRRPPVQGSPTPMQKGRSSSNTQPLNSPGLQAAGHNSLTNTYRLPYHHQSPLVNHQGNMPDLGTMTRSNYSSPLGYFNDMPGSYDNTFNGPSPNDGGDDVTKFGFDGSDDVDGDGDSTRGEADPEMMTWMKSEDDFLDNGMFNIDH